MDNRIKIFIDCNNEMFRTLDLCLETINHDDNTVIWNQIFLPNINILLGNRFKNYNLHLSFKEDKYCIKADEIVIENEFNKHDFEMICHIKDHNETDLLKNTNLIEEFAIKYLGKFWHKQFEQENKYSMCLSKLRELFDEIIDECGFSNLVADVTKIIKSNYVDYLIINNLNKLDKNKTLDDLINFCDIINSTFGVNIYDNVTIRSKIETSLKIRFDSFDCSNITHTIEHLNLLKNNSNFKKLTELNFDMMLNKSKELENILNQHLNNNSIENLEEFYLLNNNIKNFDLDYNIEELLYTNNIMDNICSIDNTESMNLINYLHKFENYENILLNIINHKIKHIYNGDHDNSDKLNYYLSLNSIIDNSSLVTNDSILQIKFYTKKYINNLIERLDTMENGNTISLEIERSYFMKNNNTKELENKIDTLETNIHSTQESNNQAHINLFNMIEKLEKRINNLNNDNNNITDDEIMKRLIEIYKKYNNTEQLSSETMNNLFI